MGFVPENQVRTRLPAGGKRIRTVGPSLCTRWSLRQECECEPGDKSGLERVGHVAGPRVRIRFPPAVSRHEILQLPGRPRDLGRLARPLASRDRGNEGVRRYLTRTSKVCFRLSLTCYRRHRSGWRAPRSDRPPPAAEGGSAAPP